MEASDERRLATVVASDERLLATVAGPSDRSIDLKLTIPQIKAEMEKTHQWLVPVATNTSKAHQGFGWAGEWANTGNEFDKKGDTHNNVIRL